MKSKQQNRALIILMILFIGVITLYLYLKTKKEKFYNDFDLARLECQQNMDASLIYEKKAGDYVKDISIQVLFDDNDLSACWFHTNLDDVTVEMDESFESLTLTERCDICYQIMEEMKPKLDEYYTNSRYYKIYKDNASADSMRYRNIHLSVYHKKVFSFRTSVHRYSFPSYGSLAVSMGSSRVSDYYQYKCVDGRVVECVPKFGSSTKETENKNVTPKKASSSSSSSNSSKTAKIRSDPYDVYDYDSADDFADDKYEEFMDYEDDYEDEDEAYDAAVDYWYDHH